MTIYVNKKIGKIRPPSRHLVFSQYKSSTHAMQSIFQETNIAQPLIHMGHLNTANESYHMLNNYQPHYSNV